MKSKFKKQEPATQILEEISKWFNIVYLLSPKKISNTVKMNYKTSNLIKTNWPSTTFLG